MIALSTIALLVAGSNAAELRGVEKESTATHFRVKKTAFAKGLSQDKIAKALELKKSTVKAQAEPAPTTPFVDEHARGYLLEWTRVNTDCSGRVEFVGGFLAGSTNSFSGGFSLSADASVSKEAYELTVYTSRQLDGTDASPVDGSEGPQCTHVESGVIPYDEGLVNVHQGYFFGHSFVKGDYSSVTDSLKGVYSEYYASKNECLLGVQPVLFSTSWVKGECYFDSNTLLGGEGINHDWYKIHGFGSDDGQHYLEYSIHNNDDCENLEAPYTKAPVVKSYAPPEYGECIPWSSEQIPIGGWQKLVTYN